MQFEDLLKPMILQHRTKVKEGPRSAQKVKKRDILDIAYRKEVEKESET